MASLISVVIPTCNRAELLWSAVASVTAQTHRPIEVVVVDDCSDGAVDEERLQAYAGRGLEVALYRRTSRGGPSAARNDGIRRAGGELIAFLDDDDTLAPEALSTIAGWLDEHPRAAVCSAWHSAVLTNGGGGVYRGPQQCSAGVLRWYDPIAALVAVARRSVGGDDLRFDESLPSCEDWDLWLRLAAHGPITVLPVPLYRYHQHTSTRVTGVGAAHAEGRRRFLAKHRDAMSPACIAHHEAHIALLAGEGQVGALRSLVVSHRPSSGLVFALLYSAGWLGARRGDPALAARVATRLLDHDPDRSRS